MFCASIAYRVIVYHTTTHTNQNNKTKKATKDETQRKNKINRRPVNDQTAVVGQYK
jgi:hypothetical protein